MNQYKKKKFLIWNALEWIPAENKRESPYLGTNSCGHKFLQSHENFEIAWH